MNVKQPPESLPSAEQSPRAETREIIVGDVVRGKIDLLEKSGLPLQSPREKVVEQVQRFTEFFDIDERFFLSSEGEVRPYILIGVADEWLSADDLEEKKGLFDLAKIVASQEWLVGKEEKTLSRRAARQAEAGNRLGYEFVTTGRPSVSVERWREKLAFAEEHTDPARTAELVSRTSIENPESLLGDVRERLGIRSGRDERPFNVRVLDVTAKELGERFNGSIAFFSAGQICLPSDYNEHLIEHEYIHSQRSGCSFGSNHILGVALMEARTEQQTSEPVHYERQREVLELIQQESSGFAQAMEAYDRNSRLSYLDSLYGTVLARFGCKGLVAALRLAPTSTCTTDASEYYHGINIFLEPDDVMGTLKELAAERSHKATEAYDAIFGSEAAHLEDDLRILERIATRRDLRGADRRRMEQLIDAKRFEVACAKAFSETGEEGWQHVAVALDLYFRELRGIPYYRYPLFLAIVEKSRKDSARMVRTISEVLDRQEGTAHDRLDLFVRQAGGAAIDFTNDANDNWAELEKVKDAVVSQMYRRYPDDYQVGFLALGVPSIRLVGTENAERQDAEEFMSLWRQIKKSLWAISPEMLDVMTFSNLVRKVAVVGTSTTLFSEEEREELRDDVRRCLAVAPKLKVGQEYDEAAKLLLDTAIARAHRFLGSR